MKNYVDNIRQLIPFLQGKDVELGMKFLNKRDFNSLLELTRSAIIIISKDLKRDNPKQSSLDANIDMLEQLEAEITIYKSLIDDYEEETE